MGEVLEHALMETLRMLPLLFAIYFAIELLEYRYGGAVRKKIVAAHRFGPLFGTAFGLLPQCGFSVVGAALYSQRLVTLGTLIAIFLATSDEAIPVIMSQPASMPIVLPLVLGKIVIALAGGYGVDLVFRGHRYAHESCGHDHTCGEQPGCCSHDVAGGRRRRDLILHPLRHTLTVFIFVFATTFALGLVLHHVGEDNIGRFFLKGSPAQPALVALVGLIPNCAASVVITQAFLKGAIGFGAAMAGLSTGAGLGLLVLIRENKSIADILRVFVVLYAVGVAAGMLIQTIWW